MAILLLGAFSYNRVWRRISLPLRDSISADMRSSSYIQALARVRDPTLVCALG